MTATIRHAARIALSPWDAFDTTSTSLAADVPAPIVANHFSIDIMTTRLRMRDVL